MVAGGAALFIFGCFISAAATSLEMLIAGRILQGLGAAGPRIGPMAIMRDIYEGRKMAQISSIVMTIFMLFPAVAPFLGSLILQVADWRAIFLSFAGFIFIGGSWLMIRQAETLPREARRPVRIGPLTAAVKEILSHRPVLLYTAALTLGFAELLAVISSIQPIYDVYFNLRESFPMWFALGALIAGTGTIVNAALVMRLGMRKLAITAFGSKIILSLLCLALLSSGILSASLAFAVWFIWATSIFFMAGLIFGNLNALSLQPLGHIAGTAASLITGMSTIGAALLAAPIGMAFNGTPFPLIVGNLCAATVAFLIMRRTIETD